MSYSTLDGLVLRYLSQRPDYAALIAAWGKAPNPMPPSHDLIEAIRDCCESIIETEPTRPYHAHKVAVTFGFYKRALRHADILDKVILDFGCGCQEALAIAVLLWANGARGVLAVDSDPLVSESRTGRFLYDFIITCLIQPEPFVWEQTQIAEFRHKLLSLDLRAFRSGYISPLFTAAPILHAVGDILELDLPDGKIDGMVSQSVFEHVGNCEQVLRQLHRKLVPGGLLCSAIDFRDHRFYTEGSSPWRYLLDDGDYYPGYINKMRFSQMMELFKTCGFSVVSNDLVEDQPPADILENILPKYRDLSLADIRINACYTLFKKQGDPGLVAASAGDH